MATHCNAGMVRRPSARAAPRAHAPVVDDEVGHDVHLDQPRHTVHLGQAHQPCNHDGERLRAGQGGTHVHMAAAAAAACARGRALARPLPVCSL